MTIEIDGSHLEGGGQIVRTALGLSAFLQKPIKIKNIRKGRSTPGLKAQHITVIDTLKLICNAKTSEYKIGSTELSFEPSDIKPITTQIDIGTAGSITLVLQSLLIPTILHGGKFKFSIIGGTDVAWSPSIDYFSEIILPHLKRFAKIEFSLIRRGYFPKGNGEILIKIRSRFKQNQILNPNPDFPIPLENGLILKNQGKLIHIKGISHASVDLQDKNVAERQAASANNPLQSSFQSQNLPIHIQTQYHNTDSIGSGVTLWAMFSDNIDDLDPMNPIRIGSDTLGKREIKAETVGETAANNLINEISKNAPLDEHLADNLIPYLGIFGGEIRCSKISDHTKSNIYVTELLTGAKFEISNENIIIAKKHNPQKTL